MMLLSQYHFLLYQVPLLFVLLISSAYAQITVHGLTPAGWVNPTTAADPTATTLPAFNDTPLIPPDPPSPPINTAFTLDVPTSTDGLTGLSIPQTGDFFGFSIEMSVITQVLGINSTHLHVPFLNLMGNIIQRAGRVRIRLGGNTQEFAGLVDHIDDHRAVAKASDVNPRNPTLTPSVIYTKDLFYMCGNISELLNIEWYFGIPFNETVNWRLEIAELAQNILGDKLGGLQAGNEPDLYADHHHRPPSYNAGDYHNEVASLISAMEANPNIPRVKNMLVGPSLGGFWPLDSVWKTKFLDVFREEIGIISVERYPTNNCYYMFGLGAPVEPQEMFHNFLNHGSGQWIASTYLESTRMAQEYGKPFMMFETNTASCGGFHGLSNSFGATLWALDYGLQLAYSNFTGALLHVGGRNVFYNPFTAPPTNESTFHQWTAGSIYYSSLVISEILSPSFTSPSSPQQPRTQVLDLEGNAGEGFTPQYAIYEDGRLAKVALFNYITDASGANDYVAEIRLPISGPQEVKVKYLEATPGSTATMDDIFWAGQTLGRKYQVDGRLQGPLMIHTIRCRTTTSTSTSTFTSTLPSPSPSSGPLITTSYTSCFIPVKAPQFALVFISPPAPPLADEDPQVTFATTAHTQLHNTATIDAEVLATSNGMGGANRPLGGSTSLGSANGAGAGGARIGVPAGWWAGAVGVVAMVLVGI